MNIEEKYPFADFQTSSAAHAEFGPIVRDAVGLFLGH